MRHKIRSTRQVTQGKIEHNHKGTMKEGTFKKKQTLKEFFAGKQRAISVKRFQKLATRGTRGASESTLFSSTYVNGEPRKVQSVSTAVVGGTYPGHNMLRAIR